MLIVLGIAGLVGAICQVARQGWCATDERRAGASSRVPTSADDDRTCRRRRCGRTRPRASSSIPPGIDRLLLADRDDAHLAEVADALGRRAVRIDFAPGDPIPSDVDVVATALPGESTTRRVRGDRGRRSRCVERRRARRDRTAARALTEREGRVRSRSRSAAVSRRAWPTCLACVTRRRCSRRSTRSASLAPVGAGPRASTPFGTSAGRSCTPGTTARGTRNILHGDNLVWFPEPIGARDCRTVTGGTSLLVDAFGAVPRVSLQLGEPPKRARFRRRFGDEGEWGAARVEVWGRRDGTLDCVVYGVVERTAVAAGAVLAVTRRGSAARSSRRLIAAGCARARVVGRSRCRSSPSLRNAAYAPRRSKASLSPEVTGADGSPAAPPVRAGDLIPPDSARPRMAHAHHKNSHAASSTRA